MLAFSTGVSFSPPETSIVMRDTWSDLEAVSGLAVSDCAVCHRGAPSVAAALATARHNAARRKAFIRECILSSTFGLRRSSRSDGLDAGSRARGSGVTEIGEAVRCVFDAFYMLLYVVATTVLCCKRSY